MRRKLKSRILSGVMALAVALALLPVTAAPVRAAAKDYDKTHWAVEYLDEVIVRKWMTGYQDGSFRPNNSITRAEFAVLIWRAMGEPEPTIENPFTDVDVSAASWYGKAVLALYERGIVNGTSAATFAPNVPVDREMGVTLLARALGISPENPDAYKEFSDHGQVSAWARDAVSVMKEEGYVDGVGNDLYAPKTQLTRAQMAKLMIVVLATAETIERDYDWYFQQSNTGYAASDNCGPTATTMAAKWANPNFDKTVEEIRDEGTPDFGGPWGFVPVEDIFYKYKVNCTHLSTIDIEEFVKQLNRGNIIMLIVDMRHITLSTNPIETPFGKMNADSVGHFLLIKGYMIDENGDLYFQMYDSSSRNRIYSDGSSYAGKDRYYLATEVKEAADNRNKHYLVIHNPNSRLSPKTQSAAQ